MKKDGIDLLDIDAYPKELQEKVKEINAKVSEINEDYLDLIYRVDVLESTLKTGIFEVFYNEKGEPSSIAWSDGFRKSLGYLTKEEFPNLFSSWTRCLLPSMKNSIIRSYESAIHDRKDGEIFSLEYPMIRKDGSVHWYRSESKIMKYKNGAPRKLMGSFADVTAEKRNIEIERISEAFSTVFDICIYVTVKDHLYYKLSESSSSKAMDYEYTGDAFDDLKRLFSELCDLRYQPIIEDIFVPEHIIARLVEQNQNGDVNGNIISEEVYSSKTNKWYRLCWIGVNYDGYSEYSNLIFGCLDFSESKNRELTQNRMLQNALEQEKSYNDIIASMNRIYFSSYYIDVEEDSFLELKSLSNIRELVGSAGNAQSKLYLMCDKLILEPHKDVMREFVDFSTLDERLKDRDVVTAQFEGVTSGWSQAYFIAGDRNPDGRVKHIFYATRKIHDEKAKELAQEKALHDAMLQAQSANLAKSRFLFNMSHDIRTPMNAIIGFTNILAENLDNEELAKSYIHKIQSSNRFLLSLINNVLEVARIENGKIDIQLKPGDIRKACRNFVSVFETEMEERGIQFDVDLRAWNYYIYFDEMRIQQLFLNIISNAMKYTPRGGHVIAILEELPSNRPGYAYFEWRISDTGVGMSKEFLPHIFEEFSRERTSTESRIQGTGLGMSIVKKYVDLLGGTIKVESELGKGTTFTVRIYHMLARKEDIPSEEKTIEQSTKSIFKNKNILLAEDNDLNAEIAMYMLSSLGFVVDRVYNGQECIDKLEEKTKEYSAVLMDIQMPVMDGYLATSIIRGNRNRRIASIPIIAMTANAFIEDKKAALDAGMDEHVAKPIEIENLSQVLARFIK